MRRMEDGSTAQVAVGAGRLAATSINDGARHEVDPMALYTLLTTADVPWASTLFDV